MPLYNALYIILITPIIQSIIHCLYLDLSFTFEEPIIFIPIYISTHKNPTVAIILNALYQLAIVFLTTPKPSAWSTPDIKSIFNKLICPEKISSGPTNVYVDILYFQFLAVIPIYTIYLVCR